jgi:hypothetical protein
MQRRCAGILGFTMYREKQGDCGVFASESQHRAQRWRQGSPVNRPISITPPHFVSMSREVPRAADRYEVTGQVNRGFTSGSLLSPTNCSWRGAISGGARIVVACGERFFTIASPQRQMYSSTSPRAADYLNGKGEDHSPFLDGSPCFLMVLHPRSPALASWRLLCSRRSHRQLFAWACSRLLISIG